MLPTQADDSWLNSLWIAFPPAAMPPGSGTTQARSKARLARAACLPVPTSSGSPCCPSQTRAASTAVGAVAAATVLGAEDPLGWVGIGP